MQGPFSLRMFHRSWGITLIQANISAPSTVLDFPARVPSRKNSEKTATTSSVSPRSSAQHFAAIDDCVGRARNGHLGHRAACRRRPLGKRRRHLLDAALSRGGRPGSHSPPAHPIRFRTSRAGDSRSVPTRIDRGHHHPFGRMPDGLQFLHNLRLFGGRGSSSISMSPAASYSS